MNNVITTAGNIPGDTEILDEMLPCTGARVHFQQIICTENRRTWTLKLTLTINGKPYIWEAETRNGSAVYDLSTTHENSRTEAQQWAIGEVLDYHYDDIMTAAEIAAEQVS